MAGELMLEGVTGNEKTIDISRFNSGIYSVELFNEQNVHVEKVIKI
jgi:hypothetical protein